MTPATPDDAPAPRRRGAGKYPVLASFGDPPIRFLGHAEAIAATPQERIRSIWPLLVRLVLRFDARLNPGARANYDPEDVLLELYALLLEKDSKWVPDRGQYYKFAGKVAANALQQIGDRAGTVQGPRNSVSRLKLYERDEVAGALSPQRAATLRALRVALVERAPLAPADPAAAAGPDPDPIEGREDLGAASVALRDLVADAGPAEAERLGRLFGLFGQAAGKKKPLHRRKPT